MRYLMLVLMLGAISCQNPKLEAALRDVQTLQESNDNLAHRLSKCDKNLALSEKDFFRVCEDSEVLAAKVTPQVQHVGSEGSISMCGVSVSVYKIDLERGWVYLRYGEGEFSDRLWFEGKRDRNSIRVSKKWDDVLLSVTSCEGTECQVECRMLVSDPNLCGDLP